MENLVIIKKDSISSKILDKTFNMLSDSMKHYISLKEDKKQSLIPYYLLSKYVDISKIMMKGNKPIHPDIYFSISHKDDYICIVTSKNKVGIDIEKIKKVDANILSFLNEDEENFFEKWTLKEAYLKMLGNNFNSFSELKYEEILKLKNIKIEYKTVEEYLICICEEIV